jgi:hypothetical protein
MPQTTDPTFYRTPGEAIAAPPEQLAYVAAYDPAGQARDAMVVLDVDPSSSSYARPATSSTTSAGTPAPAPSATTTAATATGSRWSAAT